MPSYIDGCWGLFELGEHGRARSGTFAQRGLFELGEVGGRGQETFAQARVGLTLAGRGGRGQETFAQRKHVARFGEGEAPAELPAGLEARPTRSSSFAQLGSYLGVVAAGVFVLDRILS